MTPTMYTIVLANQKGGVAKTTSAANLGAALAMRGRRVLLVDLDPQANLSEAFGVDDVRHADALGRAFVDDILWPGSDIEPRRALWTDRPIGTADERCQETEPLPAGVHLIPCTDALADAATALAAQPGAETRLADALATFNGEYDACIVDTPPGIGALMTLALLAADGVIVPARPADADIGGAIKMAQLIDDAAEQANPGIQLLGVLVTQADGRWQVARETIEALDAVGIRRLAVTIPAQVRVAKSPRYRSPIVVREPFGRVGSAYADLAHTIDVHVLPPRAAG